MRVTLPQKRLSFSVEDGLQREGQGGLSMPSFKHILFPVDFSARCEGAVPFVDDMARRNRAKVTFISVAPAYYPAITKSPLIDPQ
jgi:hypothetical protein